MTALTTGDYVVISFDAATALHGIRFRVRGNRIKLIAHAQSAPEAGDLLFRLETLGKELGISRGVYLYFTGELAGGGYFECRTADLPRREMADSLVFSAGEHLPKLPDFCRTEFVAGVPADGMVAVKAYAFPAPALEPWNEALTALKWRPDGFIYPLLALPELSPESAVLLPELGNDFFRRNGSWVPAVPEPPECNRELKQYLATFFPEGFGDDAFLGCALVAARVAQRDFAAIRPVMAVFPEALAPRRIRRQLQSTVLLLSLWLAVGLWYMGQAIYTYASARTRLVTSIDDLTSKTMELERKLKSQKKNQKEYKRILELSNGDRDFLGRLALLSGILPDDVLLSNVRAAENAWELTLLTESEELDLGRELRRLAGFKLTGLQQRAMNSSITSITAKLTAVPPAAPEEKK